MSRYSRSGEAATAPSTRAAARVEPYGGACWHPRGNYERRMRSCYEVIMHVCPLD